ncbi:hypothetical protein [Novipirellula aureliae]|nr:hypothetical protein [Novipirellula aureliae]
MTYQSLVGSLLLVLCVCFTRFSAAQDSESGSEKASTWASVEDPLQIDQPWDFAPYRVLIWIASNDPLVDAADVEDELRTYLDRDFAALWKVDIADAPPAVATAAQRHLADISFEEIASTDPVVAVKRDHPDSVRLRVAENVGQYVSTVYGTTALIEQVEQAAAEIDNETIDGVKPKLKAIEGDTLSLLEHWKKKDTEAILVARGMADTLEPAAKIITVPQNGLIIDAARNYDKIFIVRVDRRSLLTHVSSIELDSLMRHFGTVAEESCLNLSEIPSTIGLAVTDSFAPMVRIEESGVRSAKALIRAGGLALDPKSPAMINVGDVLEPMIRKNDRNGNPTTIGPLEWAFLVVKEKDGSKVEMDYHAGRAGGLQGRKNNRTFRMALRVRPVNESTMLRLHAQGDKDFPLIGYEIHDKNLETGDMTFVGRTDWNGRLEVGRIDRSPLRLMYVKNGGAILARLPMVPGLTEREVADLSGDDMRLQAEAYIRGVQNAIVDLVAIRELFAARIKNHLQSGELDRAEELFNALSKQPTSERLSDDMGRKQAAFLKALAGPQNLRQRKKIDEMFTMTRRLLSKHISPARLREIDADIIQARENGGRLPAEEEQPAEEEVVDTTK